MNGNDNPSPTPHVRNFLIIAALGAGAWWGIPKLGRVMGSGWEGIGESNTYGRLDHDGQRGTDDDEDCGCGG